MSILRRAEILFVWILIALFGLLQNGNASTCSVRSEQGWTNAEDWAWGRLCGGRVADLSIFDPVGANPVKAGSHAKSRDLRAAFLQDILSLPSFQHALAGRPVEISGAEIIDRIDFDNLDISNPLIFNDVRFDSGMSAVDGTIANFITFHDDASLDSLDFSGAMLRGVDIRSVVARDINFSNARVSQGIHMSHVFIATLFLTGTRIDLGGIRLDGRPDDPDVAESPLPNISEIEKAAQLANIIMKISAFDADISGTTQISNTRSLMPEFSQSVFHDKVIFENDEFGEPLSMDDTTFDSSLTINDGMLSHGLMLDGTSIASALSVKGTRIGEQQNEDFITLRQGNIGYSISMNSAAIGDVVLSPSFLLAPVWATGIDVSHGFSILFPSNDEPTGELNLGNAMIGGNLDVIGSSLERIDLSGATVKGELLLSPLSTDFLSSYIAKLFMRNALRSLYPRAKTAWQHFDYLDMSNAQIDQINNPFWLWPGVTVLQGAKYDQIVPITVALPKGCINGGMAGWLSHYPFQAQPYDELASVLRASGQQSDADCVLQSKVFDESKSQPRLLRAVTWLYGAVAGYGYAPQRSLWWVAGLVPLGMAVLFLSGQGRANRMPIGLFYSFSTLIPLVSLDKRFDDVKLTGLARWYFFLHRIVGYIIALFVLAALTSLSPKS